jgi:hypothetical protein
MIEHGDLDGFIGQHSQQAAYIVSCRRTNSDWRAANDALLVPREAFQN